ncbi:Oxysterol-binding protein [Aphelenchoides fujianensis]|nr:Oxysterol-binding protein [Aphelenchoides fujianensis]
MRSDARAAANNGSASISSADERGFLPDSFQNTTIEKEGWLQKWTNYIKGYRQRWFVLDSQGNLSYYRNKNEVGVACRGSVNLQESRIHADSGANLLTISATSQSFHLKANNEVDRENWLNALEYARHRAIKRADSDEEEAIAINSGSDLNQVLDGVKTTLNKKLDELKAAETEIGKLNAELSKTLSKHEESKSVGEKLKALKSQTEILVQASHSLVDLTKKEMKTVSRFAENEHEQRLQLQEQIETLAKQHSALERAAVSSTNSNTNIESSRKSNRSNDRFYSSIAAYAESDEDTFHDAQERPDELYQNDDAEDFDLTVLPADRTADNSSHQGSMVGDETDTSSRCSSNRMVKLNSMGKHEVVETPFFVTTSHEIKERRKRIPDRPQCSISLWSIMRNCIGKELTKIPMPVNFNEPLSVLQRITEDLEYADLLDHAAELTDSCEQMCYIAAFSTSCYSTTGNRTTKPFNPVLGETYECDRTADRGWWSVTEQVSHHPPSTAHHAEGRNWIMYQDFTMTSRFRGKYLSVTPTGYTHVMFKNSGNHYTYKKITTTVHNIIVGKLWIDNHGETMIENHTTGDKCQLKFHAYSYFSQDKGHKVNGVVKDQKGVPRRMVQGQWDKCMEMAKVTRHDKNSVETGNFQRIWTINPPYENSENMYRFTKLAIELNEPEPGVAPTDSRNRPDQRLMEEGKWDDANRVKEEVEERQRTSRRLREAEAEQAMRQGLAYPEYKPLWFDKTQDEYTGSVYHRYKGEYWKCKEANDWDRCPSIF